MRKSKNQFIQRISDAIFLFALTKKLKFEFDGLLLTAEEVSNEIGFLSLFLMEAKELYDSINGNIFALKYTKSIENIAIYDKPFPIMFRKADEDTVLGIIPVTANDDMFYDVLTFTLHVLNQYVNTYEKKTRNIDKIVPLEAIFEKHSKTIDSILNSLNS